MPHGGFRPGSGRKGGPSVVMRVKLDQVALLREPISPDLYCLPFYPSLPASFNAVATDWEETRLNLVKLLVSDPSAEVIARISGWSMVKAGIHDGDIALINKALTPIDGDIVAVVIDGELTAKRFRIIEGKKFLIPENDDMLPREITEDTDLYVWGVVKHTIRMHRKTNVFDYTE